MRKFRNETCTHERSVSKSYNGRALCTTRFLSIFSETEMKFSHNTDAARNVVDGLSLFISCNARATARKTETNSECLNVKASTMELLIVGRWSFGIGPIWCGHRCIYMRYDEGLIIILNIQTHGWHTAFEFSHISIWYECVFLAYNSDFSLDAVPLLARTLFGIYFVHVLLICPNAFDLSSNETNILATNSMSLSGQQLCVHSYAIKTVFKLDVHDLQLWRAP